MAKPPAVRTINAVQYRLGRAASDLAGIAAILRKAAAEPDAAAFDLAVVDRAVAEIAAVREEVQRWKLRLCGIDGEGA